MIKLQQIMKEVVTEQTILSFKLKDSGNLGIGTDKKIKDMYINNIRVATISPYKESRVKHLYGNIGSFKPSVIKYSYHVNKQEIKTLFAGNYPTQNSHYDNIFSYGERSFSSPEKAANRLFIFIKEYIKQI